MTQKIQHRLGNYKILGLLSYGSTSHVFKISQITSRNSLEPSPTSQSQFEVLSIDMAYEQQQGVQIDVSQQQSKKDMVLKLYNLERMLNKDNHFLDEIKYDLLVEFISLTYLQHPGIIQAKQMILEYQNVPSNNQVKKKLSKIGIVMQICQKGCFNSLCNYINRTKALKQNKLKIMKFYLTQIANTLMYINTQCKLLHRDLKAQNIMINKQLDIKVIDYGVSKVNLEYVQKIFHHPQKQHIFRLFGLDLNITPKELYNKIKYHESHRKNLIGSRHYISPELVQKYKSDMELIEQAYSKTDIWSFGVLMYKIFHDKYPFDGRNVRETLDLIVDDTKQPQIDPHFPQQLKEVITKCLTKDYSERPGWHEIMTCQFFKDLPQQEIFLFGSPIVSILQEHKRQKSHLLQNAQQIIFDQKLILKYQDQTNKKRRVLLLKQKSKDNFKMVILKQKQSVSLQIQLTGRDCLNIRKDEQLLIITFLNSQQTNEIKIFYENSKETVEKLIDCINEVLNSKQYNNKQKPNPSQQKV